MTLKETIAAWEAHGTDGPWNCFNVNGRQWVGPIQHKHDFGIIPVLYKTPEDKGNAALIASAPDMVTALKAAEDGMAAFEALVQDVEGGHGKYWDVTAEKKALKAFREAMG